MKNQGNQVANKPGGVIRVLTLAAVILLSYHESAVAENVTFIKEYTYQASDIDSKVSSRAIALQEVKRALLELLGTYLISETEVKNYRMSKDQVTTLTAGIVQTEIVREQWDGVSYYLQAKLIVDPKEVANAVKQIGNNAEKTREFEDSRRKIDEAMKEVARLKRELNQAKHDPNRPFNSQADYTRAIEELSARDWSGYLFSMKDGSSFIWKNYQENGDNYCTQSSYGTVCIQVSDVASIKRGEYPENAEVISRPASDPGDQRAGSSRRQDRYSGNQRDGGYQKGKTTEDPAKKRQEQPTSATTRYRGKNQDDIDSIRKNANEGSVWR